MQDFERLLASWSQELSAVIDRVRTIIGSNHWPTDGAYKEQIVQNWIQRFITAECSVGGGFIYSPANLTKLSKQIDVLIARKSIHPFWLEEGDLFIVPPQAVIGAIEVKSALRLPELRKALENIEAGFTICSESGDSNQLWAGIYAFDQQQKYSSGGVNGLKKLVRDLETESKKLMSPHNGWNISVVVHGSTVSRIRSRDGVIKASGYQVGDLAAGIFLSDLISHEALRVDKSEYLIDCIDRLEFTRVES